MRLNPETLQLAGALLLPAGVLWLLGWQVTSLSDLFGLFWLALIGAGLVSLIQSRFNHGD
ncbi:hypothetical protein [Deinococcus sp. SL84]|uniref:hypothetical protein n=1 Tax=Deinococcus sp. SL84 TaxID=2994663 RepID=UPI0022739193|nr:hypothetical protein [Deinococcus sp. SL84]MCY1703442.1 hypothetical protein [Deinococcus sp. SL84]